MSPDPSRMSREGFELLLARLDPDREQAGERYEVLRRKLIKFFGWWGCQDAEALADQALDRVARKLVEGEPIRDLAGYLMGIARLIFKEHVKNQIKLRVTVENLQRRPQPVDPREQDARQECYDNCLTKLHADSRDLVIRYYQIHGPEKAAEREALAAELQMPLNLLRVRAFRIRKKLGDCLSNCLKNRA